MSDPAPSLLPHEEPLSPRKDLWVAASFLAFSLAVFVVALRMPRFAEQGGEIYTAPGLVPSFYAVVIGVLSLWLSWRSIKRGALERAPSTATHNEGNSNGRLAIAAVLGLVFTVGLIGRMPFWLATTIFVALFIVVFEWQPGLPGARARRLGTALLQAAVTGFLVTLVFEKIFLVRLP
jgi:hypothetical protein